MINLINVLVEKYLFSDNLSVTARRLNLVYCAGIAAAIASLIVRLAIQAPYSLVIVIIAITTAVMLICNRFMLFESLTWVISISFCLVIFPLIYFYIGGLESSISAYFVLSAVIVFFLHSGKARAIMLALVFIITGACVLIGINYPFLIQPMTAWQQMVDGYCSFVIIALFIGSIVTAQHITFERERKRVKAASKLQQVVNESARLLLAEKSMDLSALLYMAMGNVARKLDIDQMWIWYREKRGDQIYWVQKYGWSVNRSMEEMAVWLNSGDNYIKSLPEWEKRFIANEVINSPINNFSHEEQIILTEYNITSILAIPVYLSKKFVGFVSFDDCRRPDHLFNNDEVGILRSAAIMFFSAIASAVMEQEREAALEQAVQASKAKGDFLSNMSHEMRTPMNAIIGMTAIGRQATNIERKDYALDKIENASTHLLGVINDILDMSKIEAGKLELSLTEFNFERMLRKVASVVNFRVEERRQNFFVSIDRQIPAYLVGDEQRLAQVITNLLSNAIKFTPQEGEIRLSATLKQETKRDGEDICVLQVSIRDSGIGISDEQQQRLFRSFEQADSGTSRKFGGTGLGLAISKNIVEMMNGDIWVESAPGEGSIFTFTAEFGRGKTQHAQPRKPNVDWKKLRILVVDNEPEVLDFFSEFCCGFGVFCDVAASGEEALELLATGNDYDMLFIDWIMPGMDGMELTRNIRQLISRKKSKKSPLITIISASEWGNIEAHAGEAGKLGYLPKPLFPSAIADLLIDSFSFSGSEDEDIERIIERGYNADYLSRGNAKGAEVKPSLPLTGAGVGEGVGVGADVGVGVGADVGVGVGVSDAGESEAASLVKLADGARAGRERIKLDILETSGDHFGAYQNSVDSAGSIRGVFDGYVLLLAEDIAINQEILLALLEPTGIEIETADNGAIALAKFKENPERYDIILMDVQMPEMNGLDATKAIRDLDIAWAGRVPIIAMTANVFREDIENCLTAGMDGHLGKPINLDETLDKLAYYLRRSIKKL